MSMEHTPGADGDRISEIISEFSEVFAFSRSRWSRYAEGIHPELSGVGMMVLQFIVRKGPLTATGLSQFLDMDKSMVSRQVSKLRELGLVEATPAPEDGRVMLLTGSETAQELIGGIRTQWAMAYRERFAGWSDEELESLRSGLHRFNAAADEARPVGPAGRCAKHASGESLP